jgi:glycosyltransferase involved in cell wall biosynthesis
MKISVVIPAHNEEQFLEQTLKNILEQDYPDFEVVVVDNASSDRTADIVKQFPVRYVFEQNKGILHAREAGRKAATGEIVVQMDADCLPDRLWLSRGARLFTSEKIVAVSGPYYFHDGDFILRTTSFYLQKIGYSIAHFFLHLFGTGAIIIGGNTFIRASALEKAGGYNTSILFYGEDTDTVQRLIKQGDIVFSPSLVMKTSARRFKNHGTIKIFYLYLMNFLWVTFFKKPYTR